MTLTGGCTAATVTPGVGCMSLTAHVSQHDWADLGKPGKTWENLGCGVTLVTFFLLNGFSHRDFYYPVTTRT